MSEPVQIADANVLVALTLKEHVDHTAARHWLTQVARFATTPMTETALVRLLLNPAITVDADGKPLAIDVALDALRAIKALPNAEFVADATSIADARALTGHVTGHRQVTDTHLLTSRSPTAASWRRSTRRSTTRCANATIGTST